MNLLAKRFDEEVKNNVLKLQSISLRDLNDFKNKKNHFEEDYFMFQIFGFLFLMFGCAMTCLYLLGALKEFVESESWIFNLVGVLICIGAVLMVAYRFFHLNTHEEAQKRNLKIKHKQDAFIEKQKEKTGDFLLASYVFVNYVKNKNENTDLIRDFLLYDENLAKSYLDLIDYHCEEAVFEKINKNIEFLIRNHEKLVS